MNGIQWILIFISFLLGRLNLWLLSDYRFLLNIEWNCFCNAYGQLDGEYSGDCIVESIHWNSIILEAHFYEANVLEHWAFVGNHKHVNSRTEHRACGLVLLHYLQRSGKVLVSKFVQLGVITDHKPIKPEIVA